MLTWTSLPIAQPQQNIFINSHTELLSHWNTIPATNAHHGQRKWWKLATRVPEPSVRYEVCISYFETVKCRQALIHQHATQLARLRNVIKPINSPSADQRVSLMSREINQIPKKSGDYYEVISICGELVFRSIFSRRQCFVNLSLAMRRLSWTLAGYWTLLDRRKPSVVSELRGCVKVEVAVLGSLSLIVLTVSVDDDAEVLLNVLRCQLTY